jgi:2Fe-2S ferredoxin
MPIVTFVEPSGGRREVAARDGDSLMQAAKSHDVPGILAECGGACACGTCHVYVDESWVERVGPPSKSEMDTLELAFDTRSSSRLSCQIELGPKLDGLVVHIPESLV